MSEQETFELDETLEKMTFYCLDEAKQKLEQSGECAPFTVIVEGENMFVENCPGEQPEQRRTMARKQVGTAAGFATHYAFCYDGFLDTDEGQLDALVVECAAREDDTSHVIVLPYTHDGETYGFEESPAYIDEAESFLFGVQAVDEETDEDESIEEDAESATEGSDA